MQSIIIRKATTHDLETLLKFEQGVIEAERPFDATLQEGKINYYNLEELIGSDNAEIVVAEWGKEIVACGYARVKTSKPYLKHQQHVYLGFMYVTPMHRGKGINSLIIDALKGWALTKNIHELRLDVYFDNAAAIQAYQKMGFTKHMIEMRLPI